MKFGIINFPGSNCELDVFRAVTDIAGAKAEHIWHKETDLRGVDCVILPGGFSYGDYLRAGAMASLSPIINEIISFANKGGLVVGICNGFQILTETKLLPGALVKNTNLNFICRRAYIKVENNSTPFTSKYNNGDILEIPIAHSEGNYRLGEDGVKKLLDNNQVIFRYCDEDGNVNQLTNPNGSIDSIAGIINEKKNIIGMMPHPERSVESLIDGTDGKPFFESILDHLS